MALQQLKRKYGFTVGLFRRSGKINYNGTSEKLLEEVSVYNTANKGENCIIIHSMWEVEGKDGNKTGVTKVNVGVYGNSLGECKWVLNSFFEPRIPVIQN
jgi:hypothetical protein